MTTLREIVVMASQLPEYLLDAPLVLDSNYTGEGYELLVDLDPVLLKGGGCALVCARGSLIYSLDYPEDNED